MLVNLASPYIILVVELLGHSSFRMPFQTIVQSDVMMVTESAFEIAYLSLSKIKGSLQPSTSIQDPPRLENNDRQSFVNQKQMFATISLVSKIDFIYSFSTYTNIPRWRRAATMLMQHP